MANLDVENNIAPASTTNASSNSVEDRLSPKTEEANNNNSSSISSLPGINISSSEPRLSAFTSLTPSGGGNASVKREPLCASKDFISSSPPSLASPSSGFQVYSKMLDSAAAVTNGFRYADLSGLPLGYGRTTGLPFGAPNSICKYR